MDKQNLDEIRLAYTSHADMQVMLREYDQATATANMLKDALEVVVKATMYWRPLAEQMEAQRNSAFAEYDQAVAVAEARAVEVARLRQALKQAENKLFQCSVGHGVADHQGYLCDLVGDSRLIMIEALSALKPLDAAATTPAEGGEERRDE